LNSIKATPKEWLFLCSYLWSWFSVATQYPKY